MIRAFVKWPVVAAGVLAGFCIGAVMVVMGVEVFSRYVMRQPTYWALEVSTYLLVMAICLGSAYTLRVNGHVAVELVYEKLPSHFKRFAYYIGMLSALGVALVLLWYGIGEVRVAIRFNDRSLTPLAMPMAYPMSMIPIGGFLLALQAIELLIKPRDDTHATAATAQDTNSGD